MYALLAVVAFGIFHQSQGLARKVFLTGCFLAVACLIGGFMYLFQVWGSGSAADINSIAWLFFYAAPVCLGAGAGLFVVFRPH